MYTKCKLSNEIHLKIHYKTSCKILLLIYSDLKSKLRDNSCETCKREVTGGDGEARNEDERKDKKNFSTTFFVV